MLENPLLNLPEGTLLRITIPLAGGTRLTLDGAVESTVGLLQVCIDGSEIRVPRAVDTDDWVLTRDLGETILLYRARLGKRLAARRFALCVESVAQHVASRRSQRIEVMIQIRKWSDPANWTRHLGAKPTQVSLSTRGICFVASDRLHPGQRLHLELTVPDTGQCLLRTEGEVIRCQTRKNATYETVISFKGLSRRDTDRLEAYFLTRNFRTMHNRVKLLGEVLSPTLELPAPHSKH